MSLTKSIQSYFRQYEESPRSVVLSSATPGLRAGDDTAFLAVITSLARDTKKQMPLLEGHPADTTGRLEELRIECIKEARQGPQRNIERLVTQLRADVKDWQCRPHSKRLDWQGSKHLMEVESGDEGVDPQFRFTVRKGGSTAQWVVSSPGSIADEIERRWNQSNKLAQTGAFTKKDELLSEYSDIFDIDAQGGVIGPRAIPLAEKPPVCGNRMLQVYRDVRECLGKKWTLEHIGSDIPAHTIARDTFN
ncbi:MAG: hypothetical protein PHZ00_07340 [Candidatus Peribacteraceae bacterium]|nr:hypothetical protein [Candidatus Peribacteraceae bacterium]